MADIPVNELKNVGNCKTYSGKHAHSLERLVDPLAWSSDSDEIGFVV